MGEADIPIIVPAGGNVTVPDIPEEAVTLVMRGLLHELANVATAADGVQSALRHEGAHALPRAQEDLAAAADRLFALHADLRSLLPDREGDTALDPRAIAADVVRLLAVHVERPLVVTLEDGVVPPILHTAWLARRQLLEGCDGAAGPATSFRFGFRVDGDDVVAVAEDGAVFWSAPTLTAARRREREARGGTGG
jgi:hypothetical protein